MKNAILIASIVITVVVASILAVAVFRWSQPADDLVLGATFSIEYAEYLNLDWHEAYLAVLDDLEVKHVRVPMYWSRIETAPGQFDFSEVDWIMNEAQKRGAQVTLATGMKVPRWPECFIPPQTRLHSEDEFRQDVLRFVEASVERYKDHPALERWQVENEPFFPFGVCPKADPERFYRELELVKRLDPAHPIQRTTSGEQSFWFLQTGGADVLGASLYRIVRTPVFGYWVFPIPPAFYAAQAKLARINVDKVVISELQAEPWLPPSPQELSLEEKYRLFDREDLKRHVEFARRTGADEIYLWGPEWWYFLKTAGESRLWDAGRQIFNDQYGG